MASPSDSTPVVRPAWDREGTVYVIGVDSMTLNIVGPLAEQGRLPNLTRLAREGCCGRLATVSPNNSSLVWTSIATGRHHRDHGVDSDEYYRLLGVRVRRGTTRKLNRYGLKMFLKALMASGLMRRYPFNRRDVRAKAFWDIVSDSGGRVGVTNWPNTWPAYPVNGFVASDGLQSWRMAALGTDTIKEQFLTFPPDLAGQLAPLIVPPDQVPFDRIKRYVNLPDDELADLVDAKLKKRDVASELRYVISSDLSAWRVFEYCLDAFSGLNLAVLLFWALDKLQHAAFRYVPFVNDPNVSDAEREIYGQVVPEAYCFIDEVVGKILARMSRRDALFLISDHGCVYEAKRGTYGHKRARPPGVFYAYGEEFQPGGRVQDASVYDVAPTLLRISGFPWARDMAGRCLEEILTPEFRRRHPPPEPVASYGSPRQPQGMES